VSSPVETLKPIGGKVVDQLGNMHPYKLMDQKTSFAEDMLLDETKLPPSFWKDDKDPAHHDSFTKALVLPLEWRRENLNGTQNEKGLFSTSLPDIFDKQSEPSLSLFFCFLLRRFNTGSYRTLNILHRPVM
jgi:hypothetical protein